MTARSEYSSSTSRVTAGVTLGLPSRSPPTQQPRVSGRALSGTVKPAARTSRSNAPSRSGTAERPSCSMYHPIARASSATVGLPGRSSSVCQSSSTSAASSSSEAPRSSPSATRRTMASTDCREDSVGCAVNTGRSSARASTSCTCAGSTSPSRAISRCSGLPSRGCPAASSRARCRCSAMLASWKNWENALLSSTAVPVSSPESRRVISASPSPSPATAERESLRTCSTSSSSSGPPCWTRVWPSIVESRRMSARRAS